MYKTILFLILLSQATQYAMAVHPSQLIFNKITSSDGLPQNTIKAIHQDSKGFMWFGAENGISRYDGYEFNNYYYDEKDENSISSPFITDITEDNNGILWIATQQGLNKYDPRINKFIRIYCNQNNIHAADNKINTLYQNDNNLWIGTNNGLYLLNILTNTLKKVTITNIKKNLEIVAIKKSSKDSLWLATNTQGIILYRPSKNQWKQYYLSENTIDDINTVKTLITHNDSLLLGTYAGLMEFNIKEQRFNRIKLGNNDENIRIVSLLKKHDTLWIGTDATNLYHYNLTEKIVYKYPYNSHDPHGLTSNMIATMYLDNDNTLWLGTLSHGIYFTDLNQKFILYRNIPGTTNSLIDDTNLVYHLYEDSKHRRWIATTKGISIYNPANLTYKNFLLGVIYRIYESPTGTIWLGGNQGIFKYNPITDSFYKENEIIIHDAMDLYQTNDNKLIISTIRGLYYWDIEKNIKNPINIRRGLNQAIESYRYSVIFKKSSNELLLASPNGLYIMNPSTYTVDELPEGKLKTELKSVHITYFYKDESNNFWLTTANKGIYKFDNNFNILEHITRKHGLPDNAVWALSIIDNIIWASTDYGLIRIIQQNQKFSIKVFKEDFLNQEFISASILRTKNNTLIFGGIRGALEFNPDSFKTDKNNISVQLTDFRLFNKSVIPDSQLLPNAIAYTNFIELNHQQNLINFKFSALNYKNSNLYYSYILDGLSNSEWVITDYRNRNISLAAIPPGNYTLRLKATDSLHNWDTKETILNINILPPWWKTLTAYFLYFLLILVIFQAFIKFRTYSLVQRSRELEKTVQQRTEEVRSKSETIERLMSKKNEVFANISHELRTPITLIKGPISQTVETMKKRDDQHSFQQELKSLVLAEKNSERLSLLVDQLLQLSNHDFLSDGHKKIQSLSQIATTIAESFQDMSKSQQLQLITHIESNIFVSALPDALDTILINLLSNAFKYTKPGGSVILTIKTNDSKALISVKDTGIGIPQDKLNSIFDRFIRANSHMKEKVAGAGVGLALVKQQIELHCGHIDVASTQGQGSEFKIELFCTKSDSLSDEQIVDYIKSHEQEKSLKEDHARQLHYLQTQLTDNKSNTTMVKVDNIPPELEKAKLLIIDDTEDMRQYLKSLLSAHYLCLIAANGQTGLSIATKEMPDIIICDVMMPGINGFEVLDNLRQDIRTSHIPILLLSAKSDRDSKLQGLSKLADDYITKPFDAEELKTRLQSILQIRQLQQQKLQQLISTTNIKEKDWDNTDLNPQEQKFLQKLNNIIEQCYRDEEFNVEQLAYQVNLSERALLYKVKGLLGKSPNEFIREYRLNRAKHLILVEKINIADLAEHVGFSNPSYFHKCFKAFVGCTPKQFIQSHTRH